ncbi:vitamin K epoxide reductase [Nakamurella sp. YIM 132087]|uniref:Vitamin K epoxide reductase n=1 Tax=Nakamurella alba TaxID=2665158 RepID=A0A7K1FES7_9ACTN|nr:vitamin K epoxide reductase family protein [Nakamurella alba]MTD12607.1 vitamin K epoxide reductase [Nakamurella alba]
MTAAAGQDRGEDLADDLDHEQYDDENVGGGIGLAAWQLIGGAIGLLAALVLTVEKIATLRDPNYVPSCSIDEVLSCGSIMSSDQAELLGFPNPLLGLIGFPMVMMVGAAALAGFYPPRWYRWAVLAGMSVALVFVHWLIWVSLYEVGALCPYCMVVWAVMAPLWWYTLLDTVDLPRLRRFHAPVLIAWYLVVAALVFFRFQEHWTSLF